MDSRQMAFDLVRGAMAALEREWGTNRLPAIFYVNKMMDHMRLLISEVLKQNHELLRAELVLIAAVAIVWLEQALAALEED